MVSWKVTPSRSAALLEKLLLMLRDEGEARILAYIRRELVGRGGASS